MCQRRQGCENKDLTGKWRLWHYSHMADLRAKDADPDLINRAHIAARVMRKTYRQFIIDGVIQAVRDVDEHFGSTKQAHKPKQAKP